MSGETRAGDNDDNESPRHADTGFAVSLRKICHRPPTIDVNPLSHEEMRVMQFQPDASSSVSIRRFLSGATQSRSRVLRLISFYEHTKVCKKNTYLNIITFCYIII